MYKKRTSTRDPRWGNRNVVVYGGSITTIPIEDIEVICNGCNANVWKEEEETFGYLIYFGKAEVKRDAPYDFYCEPCTTKSFVNAQEVT